MSDGLRKVRVLHRIRLGIKKEVVRKRCQAESAPGGPHRQSVCCLGGLGLGVGRARGVRH